MVRRSLLVLICAALLGLALVPGPAGAASAFPQGVASYATHDTARLWTRYPKGGRVSYQVSTKADFSKLADRGRVTPAETDDFTAQVEVTGLQPATKYFFRFRAGGAQARGRFRTLPDPDAPARFDFSVTADSDVYWTRHPSKQTEPLQLFRRIKESNPDFYLHLGDLIYSDPGTVEGEEDPGVALTVEEKWAIYRATRRVSAAKALFRSVSTWTQWDDHEVINDYDGAVLAQTDPALLQAGQQAFFDYVPAPADATYRKIDVGSNADFFMLDERTFRTQSPDEPDSPCRDENGELDLAPTLPEGHRELFLGLPPTDPECLEHIFDPSRTMLGAEQKAWLKANLLASDATWKFIINEVPITQLFALPYDRWEGYHAERDELLTFIRDNNVENVVFLTTDIHANWAAPLHISITDDDPRAVAYELTSGPIQTCNLECEFDSRLGEGATDDFFNAFRQFNLVDLDCVNYKVYAYKTVTVPADPTQPLRSVWRDQRKAKTGRGGRLVADLAAPGEKCDREVPVGRYPE